MHPKIQRRLTYANVMATIAVFGVLAGGGAYAASKIGPNDIGKNAVRAKHVKASAINSKKVKDFGLRLHDLGGKRNDRTSVMGASINVSPGACNAVALRGFDPAPPGLIGSLVVGSLTDDEGNAVLPDNGVVLPTMVSESSQGGATLRLMVCDLGTAGLTVPTGSVFHYHLIGP